MWWLTAFLLAMTPAEHIARGEQALLGLEYEAAAYELMVAATSPEATEDQMRRAHLLAGVAHRVLGRDTDARMNFRYVLLRAPETQMDPSMASPKVSLFFETVRQEIEAERADHRSLAATPRSPSTGAGTGVGMGTVLATVGGLVALGGAGGVTVAEVSLADPSRPGTERSGLRQLGQWSAATLGLGILVTAWGGALLLVGGDSE
jgi:hypothetical protein